jgi:hypothetical protein
LELPRYAFGRESHFYLALHNEYYDQNKAILTATQKADVRYEYGNVGEVFLVVLYYLLSSIVHWLQWPAQSIGGKVRLC